MKRRVQAILLLFMPLLLTSATTRVDYRISIRNGMGHAMDFSYADVGNSSEHKLGTVPGFDRKDFTITNPATDSVVIVERGDAMPGWEDRTGVRLKADSIVLVDR